MAKLERTFYIWLCHRSNCCRIQSNTMDLLIGKLGKITNDLFIVREKRVHPAKDDKVLVDWNGLMIAALGRANQDVGIPKYLAAATKTADFILKEMKTPDGKLFHRYAKGEKAVNGFLTTTHT